MTPDEYVAPDICLLNSVKVLLFFGRAFFLGRNAVSATPAVKVFFFFFDAPFLQFRVQGLEMRVSTISCPVGCGCSWMRDGSKLWSHSPS